MTSRDPLPTGGENGADPLQRLFDRANEDTFTARQIENLWSRLVVVMALPAPTPAPGAGAASGASAGGGPMSAATSGVGLKTVAALVVGGLVAAGAAAQGWKLHERSAPTAIVVPAIAPAAPPVTPLVADVPDPATPPLVNADSIRVMPANPSTKPGAGVNVASRPPAASPSSPSSPEYAMASPAAPTTAPPRDTSSVEAQPAAAERAPTEGALLLDARRAMATDPSGALALTQEHARRFPGGDLVLEREVLAIEALAALHRRPEARARLDALREKFPRSLHIARLERLLAP
jgi:hypothetical protein